MCHGIIRNQAAFWIKADKIEHPGQRASPHDILYGSNLANEIRIRPRVQYNRLISYHLLIPDCTPGES